MKIRDYGEVILCRNITFEDNKYDIEKGHPGIVLLPTSEKDDNVLCLYMTTDRKRAENEEGKYLKHSGKNGKDSYVNLQQIVETTNNKESKITRLANEEFIELLESFYNYQMNLEIPQKEFLEIKGKIEVLLDILKKTKESDLDDIITAELLEDLGNIADIKQRRRVYGAKFLTLKSIDKETIEREFLRSEKERVYTEKLIYVYNKLTTVDFEKLDFNDFNNELRIIYNDFRSMNYLVNANILFSDVATLFNNNIRNKIYMFIEIEEKRAQIKQQKQASRRENKKNNRRKSESKFANNAKNRRYEKKYGKSEFFE